MRSVSTYSNSNMKQLGRKTLLDEMSRAPRQLAKDIRRLTRLEVGGHVIARTDKKGIGGEERVRTSGDMYAFSATNILRMVETRNPA